jgi:hypothetical protein
MEQEQEQPQYPMAEKSDISTQNATYTKHTPKHVRKETKFGANKRVRQHVNRKRYKSPLSLQNNSPTANHDNTERNIGNI